MAAPKTKVPQIVGFAPWSPEPDTLQLVQDVLDLLADPDALSSIRPVMIRQVFYALIANRG